MNFLNRAGIVVLFALIFANLDWSTIPPLRMAFSLFVLALGSLMLLVPASTWEIILHISDGDGPSEL